MNAGGPLAEMKEGFVFDERPTYEDIDFVADQLEAFNTKSWPEHLPWRPLGIYRRHDGLITAGLFAECYAGLMFVKFLWVDERLRGQGVGTGLLTAAEGRAAAWDCHTVWLDTFTFQAPLFYQKLGYERFAALPTPPFERIMFHKRLAQVTAPNG